MPDSLEDLRRSLKKLRADIGRGSAPLSAPTKTEPEPIAPPVPSEEPELEVLEVEPAPASQRDESPPQAGSGGLRWGLIAEILGLGAAALGCWFDFGPLSAGGLSLVLAVKLGALLTPAGAHLDDSEDK